MKDTKRNANEQEVWTKEEIKQLTDLDKLGQKKANELKEMAKALGLKQSGRKDEIIERIKDFFL